MPQTRQTRQEAKAFEEFRKGMLELGYGIGKPVKAGKIRRNSPPNKTYKKRGRTYTRPSAKAFWNSGFAEGTMRNIPQANGKVVTKYLRVRKSGNKLIPFWSTRNASKCIWRR